MDNVSGVLIRFKDQFLTFTNVPGIKIGVIDIIEILIISVLFYHILFVDKDHEGIGICSRALLSYCCLCLLQHCSRWIQYCGLLRNSLI